MAKLIYTNVVTSTSRLRTVMEVLRLLLTILGSCIKRGKGAGYYFRHNAGGRNGKDAWGLGRK